MVLKDKYLKCPNRKCGYIWNYKGDSKFKACCPRCGYRVNVISMVFPKSDIKFLKNKK